jgi:two-component system sensor histidine kinase BarA
MTMPQDDPRPPRPTRPLVLIADEYADSRALYQEYLEFFGVGVITAASGEEAVLLALLHNPALILMDIRMPGMTGADAMRAIRRDASLPRMPIVAFTAHALEDERRAILADGFDGCISKPCLPEDLLTFIRTTLDPATDGHP